jgi:hypothetical protein
MSPTSHSGMPATVALILFIVMPLLLWWFAWRVGKQRGHTLRPIRALDALRGMLGRAAESGRMVHLSLGSAGLGDEQTAVAATGLSVLRYMADQGAAFGFSPVVTVADPMLMLVAQDILYRAYQRKGFAGSYAATAVHMIAPDATAYAVGAQDTVNQDEVMANIMVGHFGAEYLLLGEAGAQREIVQIVGSNSLAAQPFMLATSDRVLLGEEVFAVGAYLTRRPEYIASLYVQDAMRVLVVIAIVIGVLAKTLS